MSRAEDAGEPAARGLLESLPLARAESQPARTDQAPGLEAGDRVPDFILPDPEGRFRRFYETVAGRPALLVLAANTAQPDQWDEIVALGDVAPGLAAAGIDLFIVSNDGIDSLAMVSKAIPAPTVWFADVAGRVNEALRAGARFEFTGIVSFFIDENQRVLALRGPGSGHAPWALAEKGSLKVISPQSLSRVAPVLLLPRVLDAAFCREIVERYAGELRGQPFPIPDGPIAEKASRQVLRRVGPEVDRAFSFDDFRFEGLALRRDDAGDPAAVAVERRRNNLDAETNGRSFSLLLDLDAEGYEGGEILFPEFGPHDYRLETGGALVHSGVLLRELRGISQGRRLLLCLTLRRPPMPKAETKQ